MIRWTLARLEVRGRNAVTTAYLNRPKRSLKQVCEETAEQEAAARPACAACDLQEPCFAQRLPLPVGRSRRGGGTEAAE